MKKKCTRCGEIKGLDQFHKTSRRYKNMSTRRIDTYNYHHSICKECRNRERRRDYEDKKHCTGANEKR
jgi:hypothetical protein